MNGNPARSKYRSAGRAWAVLMLLTLTLMTGLPGASASSLSSAAPSAAPDSAAGSAARRTTGTITGVVSDSNGNPLPGALVLAHGGAWSATTDSSGSFRLPLVEAGSQTIEVSYLGFETTTADVEVEAGMTVRQSFELVPAPRFFEAITVEGDPILEGQAKALNQQKNAATIKSIVAADQIGRFPDPNSAEATQRIPGISIQRDQGEGRYVLIRGTEARLNSMMIDGERIPSPEGDVRNVALDVIPADLLQTIEVSKALTPDQDGDAIGGSVNLVMKEAPSQARVSASVAGGYNELSDDTAEKATFSMSRRFNADKLGVIFSGSYFNTDRASENFEVEYDDGELEELEYRDYEINRERIGLGLALDYEPDIDREYGFKATWNRFDDQEYRRRVRNRIGKDRMERELKDRFESQTIYSMAARGRHTFEDASRLSYKISYSYAEEDEPDRLDTTFRQKDVVFDPNVSPSSIDPDNIQANPLNEDLAEYTFDEMTFEDNLTKESDVVARLDYELPYGSSSSAGLWKLGLKYRDKSKERNNEVTVYELDDDLSLIDMLDSGYDGDPILGGRYPMGRFLSPGGARGLLGRPDLSGEKDWEEETADYDASETVLAAYVSNEIFLNEQLMLLPGLRWEHSEVDYTGYEVLFDTEGDLVSKNAVNGDSSEDLFLPHLHLRYKVDDASNVRVALTRSFARPNFGDLAPYSLILEEDLEIERGNPSLDVSTSWNLDLMYERFFSTIGLVSAGVFVKRIDDYIYDLRFEEQRDDEVFDVIQPRNGDTADLWGLELAYQNQLRSLPAPFDGLGLYLNYTYTDSEVELADREAKTATLPGQSEHVGNVAVSYEKAGFSGQISLNFHGKYIDEVGEDAASDIYYDDHTQLDLSASLRVSPKLRLFVELNNLTDEPLRYYQGHSDRPIQEEYYSWWGLFGVSYDF